MIAAKEHTLLSNFAGLHEKLGRNGHWLRDTREKAITRFNELGFPTTKLEEWKYTNVAPVAGIPFEATRFARTPVSRGVCCGLPRMPRGVIVGLIDFAHRMEVHGELCDWSAKPKKATTGR